MTRPRTGIGLAWIACVALSFGAAGAQRAPAPSGEAGPSHGTSGMEAASETPWWTPELDHLLRGLDEHPALRAATASVAASRRELEAVRFPISVDATVSATRIDATPPTVTAPPPFDDLVSTPSGWSSRASVSARFRPFVAGDLADLEAQRGVALEGARRTLREMRANLEAAAVQAAAGVLVAERAAGLATRTLEVARRTANSTDLRAEMGAATAHERARAELDLARAEERLRAARTAVTEARANLASLVGGGRGLTEIPLPPPAGGEHPAVAEALADLALADVGLRSADRELLPTAQAAYAWNTGDGSVSLSLETRTFQPTVTYETPGAFAPSGNSLPIPPEAQPTIDGSLTLGLQMSWSADGYYARDAAAARRSAAAARIEAAHGDATLAALAREEAIRAARMEWDFARREAVLAALAADDARLRERLGLEGPLVVAAEDLALQQSELTVLAARADLLAALLRGYRELAVPLSEARP